MRRGRDAVVARRRRVDGATVLGPAPLFRLRGRERAQLVLKARDRGAPRSRAVGAAVDAVAGKRTRRGVRSRVDVDPQ